MGMRKEILCRTLRFVYSRIISIACMSKYNLCKVSDITLKKDKKDKIM